MPPFDPARFMSWLRAHGAVAPSVEVVGYPGSDSQQQSHRGVHVLEDVPALARVVEIPQGLLITDLMGREGCAFGRAAFDPAKGARFSAPAIIAVVLYMMDTMRDPGHFFQPYYESLPRDYANFPVFWTEPQLTSWLCGSPVINDVRERARLMREDFDEICRVVPGFKDLYQFSDFLKVRSAVGSRNFGIMINNQKRTSMVPLADMLNHYRPRQTAWTFDPQRGAFTVTTLAALSAGQALLDSYGRKSNSRFLLHYGFTLEENREDGQCQNDLSVELCFPSVLAAKYGGVVRQQQQPQQRGTRGLLELKHPEFFSLDAPAHHWAAGGALQHQSSSTNSSSSSSVGALVGGLAALGPISGSGITPRSQEKVAEEDEHAAFMRTTVAAEGEAGAGELDPLKRAVLGISDHKHRFRLTMNREDKATREAFTFARVAVANTKELDAWMASHAAGKLPRFVSVRNEVAALELLATALRAQLKQYQRTYEANVALLKSPASLREYPLYSPQRNALVLITGEQQIATFWIHVCELIKAVSLNGQSQAPHGDMLNKLVALPRATPEEVDVWRYASWFASVVVGTSGEGSTGASAAGGEGEENVAD